MQLYRTVPLHDVAKNPIFPVHVRLTSLWLVSIVTLAIESPKSTRSYAGEDYQTLNMIYMYYCKTPTEIHYSVPMRMEHAVSGTTEKIMRLCPELILGTSKLFEYDQRRQVIVPSPSFESFIQKLVELNELDPNILHAQSRDEMNAIFQKPQEQQGLIRKDGFERWDLTDNNAKIENRQLLETMLDRMGFWSPRTLEGAVSVDHCLIFGALSERMELRIRKTIEYLERNVTVNGNIFLLGGNRQLKADELASLRQKINLLSEEQKEYWNQVFAATETATEANAFMFLWQYVASKELQEKYEDRVIGINSTRKGGSFGGTSRHRVTVDVTTEDWMQYYQEGVPQSIFALTEQPYIRLADQLRFSVLTKAKKATSDEVINRIQMSTFNFATLSPSSSIKMSVVFDEIARNVYRIRDTLLYIKTLD